MTCTNVQPVHSTFYLLFCIFLCFQNGSNIRTIIALLWSRSFFVILTILHKLKIEF
jgi:hypothetical protein